MLKELKIYFLNKSIFSKLTISFLFIIIILTTIITCWGNMSYKKSINNSQNENTNQIILQVQNSIDFYMRNTENVINYLSGDPRVLKFFKDNKLEDYNMQDSVYEPIYNYATFNPEISGIMVVNRNGGYISDVMNKVKNDSLTMEKWYKEACSNPDNFYIEIKPSGRNIDNIFKYPADNVFSMSKAVVDKKTNQILGVILIDVKLDLIKNIIENVKPGTAGFIYIMDSDDNIVYTPVNKIVYRIKPEWIENIDKEVIMKKINGENYQLTKVTSDYTGWKTIGVFPEQESMKVINDIKLKSVLAAVIGIVGAVILAMKFTKTIVSPIGRLRGLMRKAQNGDLKVYFKKDYDDEIGELGESFNTMVVEVNKLMNMVQSEEKKKRIAEMNVLQAQIKPHFMYNTLDTVRWIAEENDEKEIVKIIEAFTNLLRISLSKGKQTIRVKDEIDHIISYLTIQKIRYEDKLNYKIEVDDSILDYKVEKLILQPLVENAIYHGIKEKRGNGMIIIKALIKDGNLYFYIMDNGKGIEEDLLRKINYSLENSRVDKSKIGYGIFNVNERIKLKYGEEYGLHFESIYEIQTIVTIKHPLIK